MTLVAETANLNCIVCVCGFYVRRKKETEQLEFKNNLPVSGQTGGPEVRQLCVWFIRILVTHSMEHGISELVQIKVLRAFVCVFVLYPAVSLCVIALQLDTGCLLNINQKSHINPEPKRGLQHNML